MTDKDLYPHEIKGYDQLTGTRLIATLDKPIIRISFQFGIIKAWHPDGTHTVVIDPLEL